MSGGFPLPGAKGGGEAGRGQHGGLSGGCAERDGFA